MKGFLQEYGVIMVVVAVVLGMLAFGKTGYAKGIQDAILGGTNHIVETGENITAKTKVKPSTFIDIEGKKYIVLEKKSADKYLVMTADSIGNKAFHYGFNYSTHLRPNGQRANTYEGSEIDNYLEKEWYDSFPEKVKSAIQVTTIKQSSYATYNDTNSKQETGFKGQVYNTISRHVFLPSVSEIGKVVNLKDLNKNKTFLNGIDIWTRDSYQGNAYSAEYLYANYDTLNNLDVSAKVSMRPAFVIDLSKIDYTELEHVDYK